MKLVFMGSPPLAATALRALVEAGHEIQLVVTQAARPAGRGLRSAQPAVAVEAAALSLPVFQPTTLRSAAAQDQLRGLSPDVIVVVAYGRILPPEVLAIPRLGCLNVHLSLLPRHRGASPVSGALLCGDEETGVTIMLMAETLDSGPILAQARTPIAPSDDQITLTERLSHMGARLLVETLPQWERGAIQPAPQDESQVTWTRPTTRADGALQWERPAVELWRRVRAYAQWPRAYTWWGDRLLRIVAADYRPEGALPPGQVAMEAGPGRPAGVAIGTGQGVLLPRRLGLEGRRDLPIEAFLNGHRDFVGAHLRTPPAGSLL